MMYGIIFNLMNEVCKYHYCQKRWECIYQKVSEKLTPYPSPKQTLTLLSWYKMLAYGRGRWSVSQKP